MKPTLIFHSTIAFISIGLPATDNQRRMIREDTIVLLLTFQGNCSPPAYFHQVSLSGENVMCR